MTDNRKRAAPKDEDEREDIVDEASEESFPASDPPSWSPSHAGRPDEEHRRDKREKDKK